jgi:hypothetical protein
MLIESSSTFPRGRGKTEKDVSKFIAFVSKEEEKTLFFRILIKCSKIEFGHFVESVHHFVRISPPGANPMK